MPSVPIPSDVWMRVFHFVAPPLPYVGLERESFAEDAKEWRGDDIVKGRWKDIDSLMLVSKMINELVSPVSWSYLVLTSRSRASDFLLVLSKLSAGQQVSILRFVKVVTLGDVQPRKTRWEELTGEHPFQMLLRCLPKVSHIHLGSHLEPTQSSLLVTLANTTAPLEGLTGLVVAGVNLEAVTVALRHLAPSLRRLAVFGHDTRRPLFVGETFDDHSTLDFTSLVSITSGTSAATAQPWLGRLLAARWKMPLVRKLAIGTGAMDAKQAVGPHKWAFGLKSTAIISIHLPSLTDVGDGFPELGKVKVQELSITLRTGDPSAPPLDEFRIALDKAEGGRVDTVTSVVVVESRSASLPAYDRGLNLLVVELISRKRLPSLEKVVWVSKLKGDDGAEWSGVLIKWSHALIKAGVDFDFQ